MEHLAQASAVGGVLAYAEAVARAVTVEADGKSAVAADPAARTENAADAGPPGAFAGAFPEALPEVHPVGLHGAFPGGAAGAHPFAERCAEEPAEAGAGAEA